MKQCRSGKIALLLPVVLMAGCVSMPRGPAATATLEATQGNSASGAVTFTQTGDKVRIVATVSGLKPGGEHGFHIHEKGDCSSGDGMSTGGHFNPLGKPHGPPGQGERHAGDLPALKADMYGNASIDTTLDILSATDGPASVTGHGLIVHRDADDYKTQPTGNSGPRIACGVIVKG